MYDNSFIPQQGRTPPQVVHTCKNTSFDCWKEMVITECECKNVDYSGITPLAFLHGWEGGDTPYSFTDVYRRRQAKLR